MGADFIVDYPCPPKDALGGDDRRAGTQQILERLRSRNRAEAIRTVAEKKGESPAGRKIVLRLWNAVADKTVDREVTFEELAAHGRELAPFEAECVGCPANFRNNSFGCFGFLRYPVERRSEEWLMGRLQPEGPLGAVLCLKGMKDFGYDGGPVARMRKAGLFASPEPITRHLQGGRMPRTPVTSDQVFQAILAVGAPLNPAHCLGVLCWFGALAVDGAVVDGPEGLGAMLAMKTADDRGARTALELGPGSDDPAVLAMHALLAGLYTSWLLDAPVLVDS